MIPATNKWRRTVTMNNSRRKRISKIADALNELKGQIDELYKEEQEAFENIPESLQGTERYEAAENAVDMLYSASSRIENAISFLEDAEG
jgi:uncharacterized phage infection (PIP) family protein YhgE